MLGTVVTNRSCVYEETSRRLNSSYPCYPAGSNVIDLPVRHTKLQMFW